MEGVPIHLVPVEELLEMKRVANRPKDQEDVRALEALLAGTGA